MALLLLSTQSFGQIKALVNGVATDVDQKNGNVTALYSEFPNYMDGYEKAPFDPFKKVPPRMNILNYAEATFLKQADKQSTLKQAKASANNTPRSSKRDKFIYFEGNSSTINKNSLPKVASNSKKIIEGKAKSLLIKGWFKKNDDSSKQRIERRLEVCKAELEEKGVPSNLILTSIMESNKELRYLSILTQ